MTREELKSLIDKNIKGQGNQVDLGGVLPKILNAIAGKSYLSLERLRHYLYRITFDTLPEDNGGSNPIVGGCSAYVKDGRLYRNLDFKYDNSASFVVRCRDYEGIAFITGLNDGELQEELLNQLPYRVVDGRNNNGIMVSTHILYNDWKWRGVGEKSKPLTRLPYYVLSKVKSMATIAQDLSGVLENLAYVPELGEYLIQVLVTDGTTTYAILPPTTANQAFVLQNISSNPKLTNFRWVSSPNVVRGSLQDRPTGVERYNLMPCSLEELRFTKAYESPDRLSEFIGLRETTKDSTDEELEEIYDIAHFLYENRERNGETWQTMHSVIYGRGIEALYIQENWYDNIVVDLSNKLPFSAFVNLSALETADLTAEEATEVGFDLYTIKALQQADNPTIHFNDMCVTFTAVEVISDDLVNQSTLLVHTSAGGGELFKCILSLYTDGRIYYNVAQVQ